jgi:N-methylhydantoinase B
MMGVDRFTVLANAQLDIRNALPTTHTATARNVYEEGVLIFPLRVQQDYKDLEDVIRLCMMWIRVPKQWRGDYLAALRVARSRPGAGLGCIGSIRR